MSTFSLNIDMDNAAFDGDNIGPELARILRKLASKVEVDRASLSELAELMSSVVHDVNGNNVGDVYIEVDLDDDDVPDPEEAREAIRQDLARYDLTREALVAFLEGALSIQCYDGETADMLFEELVENIYDGTTDISTFEAFLEQFE